MTPNDMLMIIGFTLAAYSVVSNDSIQTLGTFLAANAERQWWVLWGFASSILVGVLLYGWIVNSGDPSYGRLAKFPEPTGGLNWLHIGAPLILLLLTHKKSEKKKYKNLFFRNRQSNLEPADS